MSRHTDRRPGFSFRLGLVKKDIGIDLGTANTLVYLKGKGIIIKEPSVVAIQAHSSEILAVGNEAKEMIGRTPSNIIAIRPMKNGVIADFNTTRSMLRYFISKAVRLTGLKLVRPRVLLSIPLGVTQVERRAVIEAALQAGAREAYLIEEPVASAIGAGLPVNEPVGNMIVDIGGGTSEVAIISLGGVVIGRSLRVGGDAMNEAIIRYMRRTYNLDIGERTAEQTKIEIGFAANPDPTMKTQIRGRNLATGLPNSIEVSAVEIHEALSEPVTSIIEAVKMTLEQTPPELAADIMDYGMTLAGGGALLRNLDQIISKHTNIPVRLAEDPLSCVAIGTGKALEHINLLKKLAVGQ